MALNVRLLVGVLYDPEDASDPEEGGVITYCAVCNTLVYVDTSVTADIPTEGMPAFIVHEGCVSAAMRELAGGDG
jgi:hypothetical protein